MWPKAEALHKSGKRWRRGYIGVRASQIGVLLAISVSGLAMGVGVAAVQAPLAILIAVAFVVNIIGELTLLSLRLRGRMEARRQAAGVFESEAWQFCVRVPAAYDVDDEVAVLNLRENFAARLTALTGDLPADVLDRLEPTLAMMQLRSANSDERHHRYVSKRVDAILRAAGLRSRQSELRSIAAQIAIEALLLGGAICAIVRAVGLIDVNLVGVVLASVGAVTAWLQFGASTGTESDGQSNSAFFLRAGAQAERLRKDSDAWYEVVRRIEAGAAPTGIS